MLSQSRAVGLKTSIIVPLTALFAAQMGGCPTQQTIFESVNSSVANPSASISPQPAAPQAAPPAAPSAPPAETNRGEAEPDAGVAAGAGDGGDVQEVDSTSSGSSGGSDGSAQSGDGEAASGGEASQDSESSDEPNEPVSPWDPRVGLILLGLGDVVEFDEDLAIGAPLDDLRWASDSNVACFPLTASEFFEGNHVFYALESPQPAKSIVRVTVQPDADVEVSLYGYWMSTSSYQIPPDVSRAGCEASYDSTIFGPEPGKAESIEFHNPTNNQYNIFFAVAGDAYTGTSGHYTVTVELFEAY